MQKRPERSSVETIALRLIVGIDILLLTFAIGLNAERVYTWYDQPPPCEECGE